MLEEYLKHVEERAKLGIPPKPLNKDLVKYICGKLEEKNLKDRQFYFDLISFRVSPGVDESSEVKAEWLYKIATDKINVDGISNKDAISLLGTMLGGYNVIYLVELLKNEKSAEMACNCLKDTIFVYDAYDKILKLANNNKYAQNIIESWAEAEWFTKKEELPAAITVKIYKVDGEVNTDDFSPAKHAWSRPDIPLHSLSMGEKKFPDGINTIRGFREEGYKVAFVADIVGTGSSRKSATNSLMWHIGDDIPYIPNKRRGGIVIGSLIAPIFFNTLEDSGGLPIMCDVSKLKKGEVITINFMEGKIYSDGKNVLSTFTIKPETIKDEFRAGGRLNLIIGRHLTEAARKFLNKGASTFFIKPLKNQGGPSDRFTLAQKIIGRACGLSGVSSGESIEPKITTVGSQDTTGPMTADELKELACLKFQTDLFMQSFCHTAAYPKLADVLTHKELPSFVVKRGGVALRPGDGIIHSWLNRLLLPDTVGTGGDSHTRFPIGISFPAGSGLVAFAGALGFMPLDMPESVLVKFKGTLKEGLTLRDIVNAIPYFAIKEGLLTIGAQNKKNIFNGKILEMEGLPDLTVEQAFELTDASAERSAAASTIKLSEKSVSEFLKSNIALMKKMIEEGYEDADTLKKRIANCTAWLENPVLLERDRDAKFAAVLDVDLRLIDEPILACPNDPDDVRLLSEVEGYKIDEVFIGSCMTNIGHFRAAGKIWKDQKNIETKIWLSPPTKMDEAALIREGYYAIYGQAGSRVEIPGCSLCMGNQARVAANTTVMSTSTRNFDNRMGDGAKVFLASAELAAIVAIEGRIPSSKKYFEIMKNKIIPEKDEIYKYLEFHKVENFKLSYL